MSNDTSELQLRNWFGYLASFKACAAQIDTDVASLSLLDFANAKPVTCLTDAIKQNTFAVCASSATQIPVQASDVCAASSFVALLGATFGVANVYIAAYLRSLSPAPFNAMRVGDFQLQKHKDVFPKGAADPTWVTSDTNLAKIMDASCYSATQRAAVAAIVANQAKMIADTVNQIAKLG